VIEDAAQASGAGWSRTAGGNHGHSGLFSFFPARTWVLLAMAVWWSRMTRSWPRLCACFASMVAGQILPPAGWREFRLDALQAAVLRVKLKYLAAWTAARQTNAQRYRKLFQEMGWLHGSCFLRIHPGIATISLSSGSPTATACARSSGGGVETKSTTPFPCTSRNAFGVSATEKETSLSRGCRA